jgi:amino acid adenylation domain-containing protein/non-ribosomal peptide synthase protein (TIGR01720 family)
VLENRGRLQGKKIAYQFLNESVKDSEPSFQAISFEETCIVAKNIAKVLQEKKIQNGDRVLLIYPPGIDLITAYYGCLYAGAVAILVYPPLNSRLVEKLQLIVQDAKPSLILTTCEIKKKIKKLRLLKKTSSLPVLGKLIHNSFEKYVTLGAWDEFLPMLNTDNIKIDSAIKLPPSNINTASLAFLQYSSGSTAHPKGVMVSHGNLIHNLDLMSRIGKMTDNDIGVSWLPPYHDMGLIGAILIPFFVGYTAILMSPLKFLRNPFQWLKIISDFKVTITVAPNFSFEYCVRKITQEQKKKLDLSSLRVLFNGAEPIHAKTLEHFYQAFKHSGFKKEAFHPCYGLAEATLFVSGAANTKTVNVAMAALEEHKFILSDKNKNVKTLVSCGSCFQSVKIVNPKTKYLSQDNEIGEIWVHSDSVTKGYWGKQLLTQKTFQAHIKGKGDDAKLNYLRTGDLGFIYENELYVTGRLKDVIIIRGRNLYPQDIELLVESSHDKIRLGGCAVFAIEKNDDENLTIVCEVDASASEHDWSGMVNSICRNIAGEYGISVASIVFINAKTLLKTTSGKVRRQPTKDAFLNNMLDTRHHWRTPTFSSDNQENNLVEEDALKWATDWIENHTHKKINPKLTFIEQGLDSISIVEFSQALGDQYDLEIDPLIAWEHPNIDAFVKHVVKNQQSLNRDQIVPLKNELLPKSLSSGQLRLYYLHMMHPDSHAYNIAGAFRLQGNLSIEKFQATLQTVLDRHDVLRTVIKNAQPIILAKLMVYLPIHNLMSEPVAQRENKIKRLLKAASNKQYDLSEGPLIRFLLIQLATDDYIFLTATHHIIFDGTSMFVFFKELLQLYEAQVENRPISLSAMPLQFYDFANWQQEHFTGTLKKELLKFWTNYLADVPTDLRIPYDNVKSEINTEPVIHRLHFNLPQTVSSEIEKYCGQHSITPFVFLLTAYQLLLVKYTNQNDFVIGVPTSGRTKAQAQQLIGFFVNTLPVRATADKKISIRKLLETNNKMLNTVYKHQDIPLPELISALSIERDVDGQTLIQTMFVMQNEFQFNLSTPNLDVTPYWSESGQLDYNLTMEVIPFNDQYRVVFSFNNLLLESATIKQMAKHFRNLIKSMLHKTDAMIGKLSPLDKYEFHQIVHYWNATDAQPPDARTLSKMFEQQVKTTPHSPALMFDDQTLTYDELNRKANQYANYLVSRGVQANNIVGIHLQRSVEMITCLLAILKAQGAYLALDIQYPEIRLNDLIEDSDCKLIIGDSVHNLPAAQHYRVLTLNELQDNSNNLSDENLGFLSEQAQDTLAYVIYTSGSTGKPKGVLIEHKSICQRLANISQTSMSVDQVLHITNFTFDVSVMSLWHPLTKGGTCLVACENDMRTWDIKSLQKLIHDYRITSFFATPTQLSTLLIGANEQDFATVVDVFIAGEALKSDLVNRTKQKIKNAKIWNAYGPTECTVISSIFLANDWKKSNIPIGSPLTNDKYYVLNDDLSPVPIGVIGELYIGGEGVARGYLNRTDLTETKFIPNPFIEDYKTKMYKTGDLVKWLPEGIIEYSGRIDNQVKIRGMRVELGEIEAKLIEHPQIKEAVVVVDQHSSVARIIAYLILESNPSITVADIKNYLASLLPTHMLPSNYDILDSFPMNTNGKIDYRALPAVGFKTQVATKDLRELNEVEEKLLGVFKKVLQNDNVDIYDNFFEVGGDSILSIHLTMLANEQNLNFTVQDLIKYPTIKELASTMGISTVNVAKQPRQTTGEVPLIPIQHWFIEQSLAVPHAWAQGIALTIKPNVDLAVLKSVFESVIAKHPVLNMRFKKVDGAIKQFYSEGTQTNSVDFENASLSENSLNELVDKLTASLNIYDGPLYKIAVVHDSSQDLTKMIMVVHHLVIDGISWRILLNEITFLLESSISGATVELPLETNTFKDWGLKLLEYARSDALLQEKDYWLAIKSPNKPTANEKAQNIDDKPRAKIEINLSKGQTRNLLYTRTKDSKNIQTEAILLTMLLQAYQKWTGEPELLLHLETHGRENLFNNVDINRTVGWFTSFYPALLKLPEDNLDVIETINHVNNQVQAVPNKGFGYGILRYLVQDKIIKQQLASQDNAAIIFNYLGQINGQESDFFLMEEEPFTVQSDQNKSHHPIEINAYIFNGSLRLAFNYDRRYLEDDQIKLFVEGYRQFLLSFIHHKAKTKELGIVTQLNKEQQREAIFCIHPIAGSVLSYAKLANLLEGKYTVYGIQASGLEGESLPSHSVEEMAIHYIRKVKTIQDKGPYKLMGWSMGGLIAYEMAVQLKAMGERVSFVNLIDVEDPLTMPKPESMNEKLFFYYLTTLIEDTLGDSQIKVMSWKFKLFLLLLKYNGSSHLVALLISYMMRVNEGVDPGHFKKYIGMLKHDLTTTKKTQFPIKKLVTYMKQHHLLSGAINADQFVNFYEVYRANFYAVQHYLPKAYREKIVSFSAIDSTNIRKFNSLDNDIENIDVPGNHFDVLRNLESLNIISKRLESESKAA